MSGRLEEKKVFVTQENDFMGPAICDLFSNEGAQVQSKAGPVPFDNSFNHYQKDIGEIDILIANLAHNPCTAPVQEIKDDDWQNLFNVMVHPLMTLIRHFAPQMAKRGGGKIVAITSAAPLRGISGSTAYCAARGAQNAFIKACGLEFAPHNVQINAVAQNYVSNPEYFPDALLETERFQNHLRRNVPINRIARASESAELALFLASENSDFIVGQIIPFSGGWATNT